MFLLLDPLDFFIYIRIYEYFHTGWIFTENITSASSDEYTGAVPAQPADSFKRHLSCPSFSFSHSNRIQQTVYRLFFIKSPNLFIIRLLPGYFYQFFFSVKGNPQLSGQDPSHFPAAASILPADGN